MRYKEITMNWVLEESKALQEELVRDRRWIHAHAEIGEHLPETTAYVKSRLDEIGVAYQELCDSGLMVVLGGKKPGKCIMLRADMDALPMEEQSGLPFASAHEGCAHTCGHDMHTAMMLGVVKLLKAHEEEIPGTVKAIFQPSEEPMTGAAKMLKGGLLNAPRPDAGITLHVDPITACPVGCLDLQRCGLVLASCDNYQIEIEGRGCHGAEPANGIDPITIGAHILVALQQINSREIPNGQVAVMTQGSFHAGNAGNVIANSACIKGTLRTLNEDIRQRCLKRMNDIVTNVAAAMGAKATFTVLGGTPPLINDPEIWNAAKKYFTELVGADKVVELASEPSMMSEDFACYLQEMPGIQYCLSVGSVLDGAQYPPHNPKVYFNEDPMYLGPASMVYYALRWLEDNQ